MANKIQSKIDTEKYKELAKNLDNLANSTSKASKSMKEFKSEYKEAPNLIDNVTKETKELTDEAKEMGDNLETSAKKSASAFKQIESVLKNSAIYSWAGTLKNIKNGIERLATPQAEYIEDLNFLDEAYNNSSESGLKLLDTLEKTIGYDPAGLTKQLAMFRQFGNALNMDNDIASLLAENLLKLSVDVKSITGQSLDRVTSKFASAIAGNTRAVRAYGIDVTVAGLQQEALNLGIEKTVSDMSRAEKTILMYITMARQMSAANGDMAKTVNSVANQYEIFKNQISETGRLIGGFLIPLLNSVLPLINGVMMAINVLLSSLMSLFGIDAGSLSAEFGTFSDGLEDIADDFDGIGTSAGKAGKAIKEAQKSLRGFDKLNVIKTPTATGGSSGGGVSGGVGGLGAIDSSLLSKLSEYDLHLDKISNKAAEIRDSIMKWLGFTKKIDPITGNISWEYEGIGKTISNIWESFKNLSIIGKVFVGIGIWKAFKTMWTWGGKLLGITGENGLFSNFTKLKGVLFGATGLIVGFNLISDGIKKVITEADNGIGILEVYGGTLSNVLGGALIGYQVGGTTGSIIGGLIGIGTSLVETFAALGERHDYFADSLESNRKTLDEYSESLRNQYKTLEENASQDLTLIGSHEKLLGMLKEITDENGKINKGYEDRATFIVTELNKAYGTEMEIVNDTVKGLEKGTQEIEKTIKLNKARILQDLAAEKYRIAIQEEARTWEELNHAKALQMTAQMRLNEAQDKYNEILHDESLGFQQRNTMLYLAQQRIDDLQGQYDEMTDQVNEATRNLDLNQQAIANYSGITTAIVEGDEKAIEEYGRKISENYAGITQSGVESYQQLERKAVEYWKSRIKETGKSYDELTEQQKNFVNEQIQTFVNAFKQEVEETNKISPEMIGAWREMADSSEEAFLVALEKLPDDLKVQVVNEMYPQGQGMSTKLQEGINSKFPKLKIVPELNQPSNSILQKFKDTLGKSLSGIGINIGNLFTGTAKADGGLYSSGIWRPMKTYANGGFPSQGELFMAREKGPELVGRIGNSTAVMNNNQILDQMTIAVARGMSAVNKDTNVNIVAEGDTEGLMNFIKFKQISQNRQYGL